MLRDDVLPALDLNVTKAAKLLGVSRQTLHKIMREDNPATVTADMAVRLGKLCGNGPKLWANMQTNYDLWPIIQHMDELNIPTLDAGASVA
jgi:addiction module HigA family antidote